MDSRSLPISQRVAEFTVVNRYLLFIVATVITALLSMGILRTSFDTSLSALLSESDPYLDELDLLEQQFPSSSEIRFAFIAEEGETIFTREILEAIRELEDIFTEIPRIRGITTVLEYTAPETQRRLFSKELAEYTADEFLEVSNTATNDQLLTSNLLSQNGALTFAVITLNSRDASNEVRLEIADAVLEVQDQLRTNHPNVALFANADVLLEQSSQQAMVEDLTSLLPIVILLCVLVICFCFKSIAIGGSILTHVIFSLISTVGALGFLNFSFNNISIMAPLVVVIICVATSVHIISIYKQALHKGQNKVDSMRHSMAYNFQPVTLAALTTAIGFSSLNMCSSPAVQDFGRIVSLGIVFSYVLTLLMLPTLLIWLSKIPKESDRVGVPFLQNELQQLIDFTNRWNKQIFVGCSALAIFTLLMLPLNETDFDRLDYIASDSDIQLYYDLVSEHMNRGPSITYGIDSNFEEGAIDPEFLAEVDEFSAWLMEQSDVESVISLTEVLKTVNQIVNDNDEDYFLLPVDRRTNINYLNAYRMVEQNYFPLSSFLNSDSSYITLTVNAAPMSNQEIIDLDERIGAKFDETFSSANLIHGSGILLFARMDELVTVELLQGYSVSLLLITLCLVVGFRSFYFGVLSVLPNLLPATIVFGMWALFVGQLDPFVMMVFSISIGMVVDDTVHILSHYLEGRKAGADKSGAVAHSIKIAGPALTITTMVLAFGTTVMIFANTLYFQQSAKLLVPIVVLALVLDLIYLPTILKRFDNRFKAVDAVTS
ncbi:MAG: MMPL family transporter [Pseudomonadales bacterium]|nr:MMPL family transporter [Pseudomonadales bacterium]